MIDNPFVIGEYLGDEYFCDREHETNELVHLITNGDNVVLSSPSSVSSTASLLLDKDLITREGDAYYIYDRFFSLWLKRRG